MTTATDRRIAREAVRRQRARRGTLIAALSSLMTLYLVRTAHPEPADEGTDDGTRSPE